MRMGMEAGKCSDNYYNGLSKPGLQGRYPCVDASSPNNTLRYGCDTRSLRLSATASSISFIQKNTRFFSSHRLGMGTRTVAASPGRAKGGYFVPT
jgi:hypothetical protein